MSGSHAAEQGAVARVEAALRRIEAARPLNAVTTMLAARALARAAALDRARSSGAAPGPLQGIPFVAKNLFDVADVVTRAGSAVTAGDLPACDDAFAIAALERAGAVLVATANMDELAYGFTGENGPDGDTRNPHDAARISGGSSSGSAALVGAGVVDLALGSDTNGSIRVPSALCGAFGLKATYGRLSRGGVYPFVASLDHVGPIAATPQLLAKAYDALQGADPDDPVQVPRDDELATPALGAGIAGLRVGILGGYFAGPLDPDATEALAAAAAVLGASEVVELRLAEAGRAAAFVITTSEAGHLHRAALSRDPEAFGPLVRDRLAAGALTPAAWYLAAQKLRRRLAKELSALFARFDLLLAPAVPCVAPMRGAETITVEDRTLPMRLAVGMYTHPLTLTGVPVGVAPRAARGALSVGVQVVAPSWHEVRVLRALAALDAAGFSHSVRMEITR